MSNLFWLTDEQMARLRPFVTLSQIFAQAESQQPLGTVVLPGRHNCHEREHTGLAELPLADHMRCFNSSKRRSDCMERLETEHGTRNPFNETMVLLNHVVEIF